MNAIPNPKHREIMRFVQRHLAQTGYAPTLSDIRDEFQLSSKSRAHAVISMLVEQGFLYRTPHTTRGLTVLKPIPDDRFEEAAKAVCAALGQEANENNVAAARAALFNKLVHEPEAA